jgi:two-component system phosphate regulon sensor histidine kinase PhoR
LGLAICKHIIEAHGQTIHVRSKIDVGTTIGFTLERKKD